MSETIEDAKTEPRPIWTKLKDGWKVRIPKEWWDNWSEAGETDEFPVFKANGEVSHVNIVNPTLDYPNKVADECEKWFRKLSEWGLLHGWHEGMYV